MIIRSNNIQFFGRTYGDCLRVESPLSDYWKEIYDLIPEPSVSLLPVDSSQINIQSMAVYNLGGELMTLPHSAGSSVTDTVAVLAPSDQTIKGDIVMNYCMDEIYAVEQNTYQRSLTITCSISGTTPISYTITQSGSNPVPSWVSLDIMNQKLVMTPPKVQLSGKVDFWVLFVT